MSRPRRRSGALLASLAVLAATTTAGPAHAAQPTGSGPVAGAAGAGDPYFPQAGNGGYDVAHYSIQDTYRLRSGLLSGRTDLRARATQTLSSFHLDLVLTPDAVLVDGAPAHFAKPSRHELVVTPSAPIAKGRPFTVRVRYHGTPRRARADGTRPWVSSRTEALATNEPDIAPWWFAADDHPSDKATYDIDIRVPRGHQVVSNGELVSRKVGSRWSRWHWRMEDPMASYLAFFAAGRFRTESGTSHGLRYYNAVSKGLPVRLRAQAMRLMDRTPALVRWLETQFGPYPFSSTGGVTTSLWAGFALENQSRPTYPFMGSGRAAVTTVVHELAHQWFGDDVSVERWRDIWLNEGFASWAEWRYAETHGGLRAQTRLLRTYRSRPAGFWRLDIGDPGRGRLFDVPVYLRGAMALQALRHRIGDRDFTTLLHTWVADHAGGNGRTEEFQALASRISGQNLDGFFHAWLHSTTRPARTAANGLR